MMKKTILASILIVAISALFTAIGGSAYYAYRAMKAPIRFAYRYDIPSVITEDPYSGFGNRPNLAVTIPAGDSSYKVFTDRFGNRAASSGAPELSQFDIVSIGCSQTWGHGVPAEQTFAGLSGTLLNTSAINLGVPGYGGVTALRKLQHSWHLRPKYVVYGYWYDHDNRNLSPCASSVFDICLATPYVDLHDPNPAVREAFPGNGLRLKDAYNQLRDLGKGRESYSLRADMYWLFRRDWKTALGNLDWTAAVAPRFQTNFPDLEREKAARYVLDMLADEVKAHDATLIVVFIPNYFASGALQSAPNFVVDQLRSKGVTLLDMTADFEEARTRKGPQILMIPNDGHLSAEAHEMIAKKVAKSIRSSAGLP